MTIVETIVLPTKWYTSLFLESLVNCISHTVGILTYVHLSEHSITSVWISLLSVFFVTFMLNFAVFKFTGYAPLSNIKTKKIVSPPPPKRLIDLKVVSKMRKTAA